jgi:GH15 family glucan-1,4-alpha-glucosidase
VKRAIPATFMPLPIENYGLIGDTRSAALVGNDGSIDWLCLPRFDSDSCFAALLGDRRNGRWRLAPDSTARVRRSYRPGSLVLETVFTAEHGSVRLTDCMALGHKSPAVLRCVECLDGEVTLLCDLVLRFGYGSSIPWIRRRRNGHVAISGPEAVLFTSDVETRRKDSDIVGRFTLKKGERAGFALTWFRSNEGEPDPPDCHDAICKTDEWWRNWSSRCCYAGEWREDVVRSLITLKALIYDPTGGIIAAPTTSLPERLGGVRNWDYRFCWLRDATFTLYALMLEGYENEARAWRDWVLRAAAGHPAALQTIYGAGGERRLIELELDWLPGYEGSKPVRIGNRAVTQFQLDVYGELMDSMHQARRCGIQPEPAAWDFQRAVMDSLESRWDLPDEGIWEVRGPRRHFVHSKVMAWVAADRAVKAVEQFGLKGPAERWRALRRNIHEEVCRRGWDSERRTFTQYYGSKELDASVLLITLVGFLPPDDERIRGTVEAIRRELVRDGFVIRYPTHESIDGLPAGEGVFLPCSFWLADSLEVLGRHDEARALFERLLSLKNDLGLLAEEYDPASKRLLGNFPQAFTHVSLVNTARNLQERGGPADQRRE